MIKMRRIFLYFLTSIAFCIVISCKSDSDTNIETYTVKRGNLVVSVRETGELEAVHSQTLSAPMIPWHLGGLKIAKLVDDGKQVEKDEILVEFDKTEVQKNLDDAKAKLDIALAELRKAQATQKSEIEDLESELEKSELQYRISQLELEKAEFEAEINKKQIELDLEKAGIALEKARQEIENKKKVHREELSKLELQVQQERTKVEEAEETLAKLTLKAPAPGIAILQKNWTTDNKVQVDDDVWRGQPVIGLPDLSLMQAIVPVNEVDIAKIDTGLKAIIRMDAFPDTSFRGSVTEIAALARNKDKDSKVKVFDVTVLLKESARTLMPGLTVSCEIVVDEIENTIYIPIDALFNREEEIIVYLKKGDGFHAQSVATGPESDDYVVITGGLQEGDAVALLDPTSQTLAFEPEQKTTEKKSQ